MDEVQKDVQETQAVQEAQAVQPSVEEKTETEVSLTVIYGELQEVRKDTHACLEACKEIAKATGELSANVEKWRKAGKF